MFRYDLNLTFEHELSPLMWSRAPLSLKLFSIEAMDSEERTQTRGSTSFEGKEHKYI